MSVNLAVIMRFLIDMCFSKYSSKSVHDVSLMDSASHSTALWSVLEGMPTFCLTEAIIKAVLFVNPGSITGAALSDGIEVMISLWRVITDICRIFVWLIVATLSLVDDIHFCRFVIDLGEQLLKVGVSKLRKLELVIRHCWQFFLFFVSHKLWDHYLCDAYLIQPSSVLSMVKECGLKCFWH